MELKIKQIKHKKRFLINPYGQVIEFSKLQLKGKNGTGKTTFLRYLKKDLSMLGASDIKVVHINQKLILFQGLTIGENIDLLAVHNDYDIYHSLVEVFPELMLGTKVKSLSGGQKQMLHLLIALSHPADVYLVDEPFNNLDRKVRQLINSKLAQMKENLIVVSHGNEFEFCDTVIEIDEKNINIIKACV